jgi:hypothetical protein
MYWWKRKKKLVCTPKTCHICGKNNIERKEYREHIFKEHLLEKKEIRCQHCEKTFQNPAKDFRHYKVKHTERPKEEIKVKDILQENNIKYKYQYAINKMCEIEDAETENFFMLIDFKIERDDTFILLEIDEKQHRDRKKTEEKKRMEIINEKVLEENETTKILWIRYNPNNSNITTEEKEKTLITVINEYKIENGVEYVYLFYEKKTQRKKRRKRKKKETKEEKEDEDILEIPYVEV